MSKIYKEIRNKDFPWKTSYQDRMHEAVHGVSAGLEEIIVNNHSWHEFVNTRSLQKSILLYLLHTYPFAQLHLHTFAQNEKRSLV